MFNVNINDILKWQNEHSKSYRDIFFLNTQFGKEPPTDHSNSISTADADTAYLAQPLEVFNPSNLGQSQTQNFLMQNSNVDGYADSIRKINQILSNQQPQTQIQPSNTPTTPVETSINPLPTPQPQVETPVAQNQPNPPSAYDLARLASGDINDKNQWYISQIASAKNLWNTAQTDADRKAAADYANYIRNLAQMRDIGLGQFGDGNNLTTEQANLAWGNYVLDEAEKAQKKFQSVQENLSTNYRESSNDHFWRLYDEFRQNGDSHNIAAIKAGRDTLGYQQDLVETLNSAIAEHGIDGETMNQFGLNNLARLAGEGEYGSNAANVYANSFMTPKANYEKQQEMARAIMQNQTAMEKLYATIRANAENLAFTERKKDERQDKTLSHQNYQNKQKYDYEWQLEKFKQREQNRRFYDRLKSEEERAELDRLNKLAVAEIKKNNSNGKQKSQAELDKQYGDIKAKYDKYAEEHPDTYNPYADAVESARRLKDHVFEASPDSEQGMWSWITDVLSEHIIDTGQKMTYDELVDFFRKRFPNNQYVEGALKTVKDQKNEYVRW